MGFIQWGEEAFRKSWEFMKSIVGVTGGALGQAEPGRLSKSSTRQNDRTTSAAMPNRYRGRR